MNLHKKAKVQIFMQQILCCKIKFYGNVHIFHDPCYAISLETAVMTRAMDWADMILLTFIQYYPSVKDHGQRALLGTKFSFF